MPRVPTSERRALLVGAAGPVLARARALHGEPLTRLSQPQLEAQAVAAGDRVFVAAFSARRQLELLGALHVARREGPDAVAATPLARCEPGCVVPHDTARGLRDTHGAGLRFARAERYELHPTALVHPLVLDARSEAALAALLVDVSDSSGRATAEDAANGATDELVTDLGLSLSCAEALVNEGISTVAQLRELPPGELASIPNLQRKALVQIDRRLDRPPTGHWRAAEAPIAFPGMSLRASNALQRAGITTMAALRATPRERLWRVPHLGAEGFAEVEALLAEGSGNAAAVAPAPTTAGARGLGTLSLSPGLADTLMSSGYDDPDALLDANRARLAAIPGIGVRGASEVAEALARGGSLLPSGATAGRSLDELRHLPSDLREALYRAGEIDAESLAERSGRELRALPGIGPTGVNAVALALEQAGLPSNAGGTDDRNATIARERLDGATLESIAARHRITRERVRQIVMQFGVSVADASEARRAAEEMRAEKAAGELRARYRAGEDLAEVSRELGLQRSAVDAVLARVLTQNDRAIRVAKSERSTSAALRRTSNEALLDGLRAAAALRNGETPTSPQYTAYARSVGLPGAQTVMQRFGSWSAAVEAAGMAPRVRNRAYKRRWDEQRCREAARMLARELQRWPTVAEYESLAENRTSMPSSATLRNRLGAWSAIAVEMTRLLEADRNLRDGSSA